ncbi:immunity protein Imm33 domain-containing protein [Paraburkholderia bannensis]|uniref:immunity protein Imm33 domain-containing protein n=1 Tax=Paraburkholderia bannensis TaxID=765414 RepID=UPI002AB7D3FA|nr:hypothetical protein [Paraburkholderia bannensis]
MNDKASRTLRERQQAMCQKYGLDETPPEQMVALAIGSLGRMPVYGTRVPLPEGGNIGWFIHCGEYSDAPDFYQPLHVEHLAARLPRVLDYLALPPGVRFIIDDEGYEDVWLDG